MKTIEDKLHIAHELGRIAGAAECIDDEGTRDTIYGAAMSLFDGMLTEAGEEATEEVRRLVRSTCDYPPDPFDYAEVEDTEEPPKKETNFDRLTKSPERLAVFINSHVACPPPLIHGGCPHEGKRTCMECWEDWLKEEAKKE